ncbi:NAD(P)H-binding protein [Rathayibacter sp. VKM Ac-2630]|uniref:NAD(P)H-binding protein n=1 Tax=Rathayibacter sp. VKM Ac-2630 TaxID=1938617 RepID=UPI001F277EFF|nr:NAD(P)H-binding protein [Rathayibacter sp. VKM Ac-2630]
MTRVAVIGAHGKVGQQILHLLYDAGHESVGVIRNPEHAEDIVRLGGEPLVHDLESSSAEAFAALLEGVDALVFTAGAGPDSGIERKRTVDLGASVLSQEAAVAAGIRRFVQISAIGVDEPLAEDTEEVWRAYVEAKRDADTALRSTDLDWTILRPGVSRPTRAPAASLSARRSSAAASRARTSRPWSSRCSSSPRPSDGRGSSSRATYPSRTRSPAPDAVGRRPPEGRRRPVRLEWCG